VWILLIGLGGGITGWIMSRLIDRKTGENRRAETLVTVALSAAVPAALVIRFHGAGAPVLTYGILSVVLTGVSVFDLRKKLIPHWVTVPGTLAGIAVSTWVLPSGFRNSIAGALTGAGILLFTTLVEAVRHKDIGGGDWKLAAVIGSFVGPRKVIVAMISGGLAGAVAGLVVARRAAARRAAARRALPAALGPYLSAGAIVSMFWN
jgi:leader peptidase (prepilin peptidase)/N-methyltransferase